MYLRFAKDFSQASDYVNAIYSVGVTVASHSKG
jgi:hypothetical protein